MCAVERRDRGKGGLGIAASQATELPETVAAETLHIRFPGVLAAMIFSK